MTYSLGGLIQASDYNAFAGGATANVSGQVNTLYSTGSGNAGYGQGTVSNVSVSGTVTAAQWSTLVGAINVVRKHQSGAGFSNLSLYTTGTTINADTDVGTNATTGYTNRLVRDTLGTTTTGSNYSLVVSSPNTTAAVSNNVTRTATFGGGNNARYFFNAGGELRFYVSGYTNTGGTTRGVALGGTCATGFGGKTLKAQDMSARYGTGLTVTTDLTSGAGYYSLTTSAVVKSKITGSTYASVYNADYCQLEVWSNGPQGSNGDAGSIISMRLTAYSGAQSPAFNDSINVSITHRIDVAYPSTAYLSNSWGTVTIA